jgi:hypothetical protein
MGTIEKTWAKPAATELERLREHGLDRDPEGRYFIRSV